MRSQEVFRENSSGELSRSTHGGRDDGGCKPNPCIIISYTRNKARRLVAVWTDELVLLSSS